MIIESLCFIRLGFAVSYFIDGQTRVIMNRGENGRKKETLMIGERDK